MEFAERLKTLRKQEKFTQVQKKELIEFMEKRKSVFEKKDF